MLAWIKWIVKEHKAIAAFILFIMGIMGISLYGNINEINPWKAGEEVVEEEVKEILTSEPQVKIIERIIETKVESGITKLQVDAAIEAYMDRHIREYH